MRHILGLLVANLILVMTGGVKAEPPVTQVLQDALAGKWPRPDLVLRAVDHSDAAQRRLAAESLSTWWEHIPGRVSLLRRLMNDQSADVQVSAIETAANRGGLELLVLAAKVILERDAAWLPMERVRIVDAMDQRHVRPYWMHGEPLPLQSWMDLAMASRNKPHRLASLKSQPIPPATVDVIESGLTSFVRAKCVLCHQVAGYGQPLGPELRGIGQCYDHLTLLRHVLDPSLDIHDAGRAEQIVTMDDQLIVGQIVDRDDSAIWVRTQMTRPAERRRIERGQIRSRRPSPVSPMPVGLTDRLTPTQLAELAVFLRTDGGERVMLDAEPHH
ncbi:MAG: hypothetical protein AAGC97_15440 [Planctomycetota bacterium]